MTHEMMMAEYNRPKAHIEMDCTWVINVVGLTAADGERILKGLNAIVRCRDIWGENVEEEDEYMLLRPGFFASLPYSQNPYIAADALRKAGAIVTFGAMERSA